MAVPEKIVTNDELEKTLDTSNEWIVTRTGIKQRFIADNHDPDCAARLGADAAAQALQRAGIGADQVDGIICATFTPDNFFPSTACRIQTMLGCRAGWAFDLSAACSGFLYGLSIATAQIRSGVARTILLVGSEIISKTLDWNDRATAILFGDGAGAVVLRGGKGGSDGVLATYMHSDGKLGNILTLPAWGANRTMKMRGNDVFKHAVRMMSDASVKVLHSAGIERSNIDLLIPHQANVRIINALAEHLGVPMQKVIVNIDRFANTSSASIPIALYEAWENGKITPGTIVVMTSLGGGVTIGSAVIRF
jgi:3-oxoacyl-[acyl-carrier-protein] synthase-3